MVELREGPFIFRFRSAGSTTDEWGITYARMDKPPWYEKIGIGTAYLLALTAGVLFWWLIDILRGT